MYKGKGRVTMINEVGCGLCQTRFMTELGAAFHFRAILELVPIRAMTLTEESILQSIIHVQCPLYT